MKALVLALALTLGIPDPASEHRPVRVTEPTLTVRVTSASPTREVAVEGVYSFGEDNFVDRRIERTTPFELSGESEHVEALLRSTEEDGLIHVQVLRGSGTQLVSGGGRVVQVTTAGNGRGGQYVIHAY